MNKCRPIDWISFGLCVLLTFGAAPPVRAGTQRLADVTGGDDPFAALGLPSQPTAVTRIVDANEPPPELFLESVVLRFLDPNSLMSVLERMRTPYGAVSVNKMNRSIVLCDTRENLDRMITQIKKADRTPQQVMVEVVLLDVQLKDDSEIGVNWDLLSNERYPFGYRQNLTTSRLSSTPETSGTASGTADTIGSATAFNSLGTGGDIGVIFGTVRNVIHLVQEKRNVNILAAPRTLVVSGRSATIDAVEQIPYREVTDTGAGGQGALTSTQFKDVGVKLQVSVVVTDDNDIFLTVASEQSVKTGESADGIPVTDSRKTDTSLLLKNGETVVIGGLRREEKTRQVSQIPLLGDLPLIGFLFKTTIVGKSKSELVVLLSPRLNQSGPLPAQVAARVEDVHRENWLSHRDEEEKAKSPSSETPAQ